MKSKRDKCLKVPVSSALSSTNRNFLCSKIKTPEQNSGVFCKIRIRISWII